jgi:predicted DCC family thiol-disulfide oxidoreductase YuxK
VNHATNFLKNWNRIRLWLVLMVFSLGLWLVFAKLLVPAIIESAYRGESWSFLNRMIRGQATHPVSEYLQDWGTVTMPVLLWGLGFWLVVLVISSPAFVRRMVGAATPGSLGAIRMWTCLVLLLTTFIENLPSIALLPVELRQPDAGWEHQYGVMHFFSSLPVGFETLVTSRTSLLIFQLLTELVLFLGVIGWKTRVVIPLGAFCALLMNGILIDYSFFWHQNLVPIYLMAVLSFTPCGDGWSVDRLWKVYRGQPVPAADRGTPTYGWSRYACWTVIALPYLLNGLGKLRYGGLFWWNATNMRRILYHDSLTPREFNWAWSLYLAPAPDILFACLGLFALFTETAFAIVLFSRIARRILPTMAMMMHIGIFLLQRILFLDLILLQLVFFDFTRLPKTIGERLQARRGRIQLLYDGLCPLCRRTIGMLACFDLFARLEFLDFRRLDLTGFNRSHQLNLTSERLAEEMYVVSHGTAYRGFDGYRVIALALPAFWPLVPWLFLPGISVLGTLAYRYVARNRSKFLLCHGRCSIEPVEGSGSTGATARNDLARGGFNYALAVSGLICMNLYCWYHVVEFYPLTAWALFANSDTSGQITYNKVLARYESGVIAPARLEDTIGALALDNRYVPLLERCFGQQPSDMYICRKYLSAAGSAYNQNASLGRRITHYEVQKWAWDFRTHPLDPQYGSLVQRIVHEIDGAAHLKKGPETTEQRSGT